MNSPRAQLMRIVNGFQLSQAVHVAATLGVADLLVDGPQASEDLAAKTGADPQSLHRLLRALAAAGVFHEHHDHRFSLTPIGEGLRSDSPEPVGPWAALIGRPNYWNAWSNLLQSVRKGQTAFRDVHGMGPWELRQRDPEEGAAFDAAMAALTAQVVRTIVESYDFSRCAAIVDVGGGSGALLAGILRANPACRGTLLDLPHVVSGAPQVLAAAGVADRCEIVAGNFFQSQPHGGDLYLMKSVLHDWTDADALTILQTCRAAITPHAKLLLIEQLLAGPNEGLVSKMSDVNMLVVSGGRERTLVEFDDLLARAGFRTGSVTPTSCALSIIECTPATDGLEFRAKT